FTDLGPQVGNILNAHYFPAMNYYKGGLYTEALPDLNYFIDAWSYTNGNPNQAEYQSNAHYVRGMIYAYHATGLGRLTLAMNDFAAAIDWNAKNYPAYLELARVFSTAGLKKQAASILEGLLELRPDDEKVAEEARRELSTIVPKPLPPVDTPA